MTNLYLENKYGPDTLKKRLKDDRTTVLRFEKRRLTPVVDTSVKNNFMQMLNANSYQKGGWVLHMLRRKLGDSVFWKGIRSYYAQYKNGNANTNDLCRVMQKVSGQNLEQFFKQWLYTPGHPQLEITWKYNPADQRVEINVNQKQDVLFDFPLEVSLDNEIHIIHVNSKNSVAVFAIKGKPSPVIFDPNVNLLAGFAVEESQ